jgi:hypothetical protein
MCELTKLVRAVFTVPGFMRLMDLRLMRWCVAGTYESQ